VFLKRKRFQPQVEVLEDRLTPSVSVLDGFNGLYNHGYNPPDTNMAAGPNYIVETVNSSVAIFNKATGALVSQETLSMLFSGFDPGDTGPYDPSVLYDDQAGRFVVEGQVANSSTHRAYIDIAVSNSSDPTQGFSEIHQIEVDEGGLYWSDAGKLGFNADAYVFTGNAAQFTSTGTFHEIVLTIKKSTVLDQNNSTLTDYPVDEWWGSSDYFSLIPARMHGSAAGGPMWFVETDFGADNAVTVTRMDNVLSSSPTFTNFSLIVNSYATPSSNVLQPGGGVDTGDCRTLNVEWNNSNLVAAFNSAVGSDAAAAWFQFNTNGSRPAVVQQGVIHPANGISTYMPSVAVDASGDLGLTYMESSGSEYVSMYVTGRLASDPAGTLEAPVRVVAGTGITSNRVGDYSGISLDPSTANTFWAGNEYAQNFWSTWLAKFQVTGSGSGNQPPTVASPASANPNPVTGTTTALSVLGADNTGESSLTYTWSVLSQPSGAQNPGFSANGTNVAKTTTVTFYQPGNYTFQVSITDPAGLTSTSSVTVTVIDQPPTVAAPAAASLNPVTGTAASLSALGADDTGESSLTYTWSVQSEPAGAMNPMFSANGTNAAKNTTATFYQAGSYTFQATITDPAGLTTTSSVTIAVNQTATSLDINPENATLPDNAGQQFIASACDQFGSAMASQPSFSWSLDGIGTLDATGMYSAPTSGSGSATVTASVATTGSVPASSATMSATAAITVISGPSLTAAAISSSQVKLSWTDPATETGYRVLRSTNGGAWSQIASLTSTSTAYTDTSLSAGSTYDYLVQGYNPGGSSNSNQASVTFAPKAPGGLSAKTFSSSQINLSWSDVTGETGFKVERSLDKVNWTPAGATTANVTAFQDTGLSPATRYYYRVRASNTGGDSAPSSTVNATTLPVPPAAPSTLSAVTTSPAQVNLSWTDNSNNEQGFRIQRSGDGGNTWSQIGQAGANATTFSDTRASHGTTYWYRVYAYNGAGNSPYTNAAQVTTPLLPTHSPSPQPELPEADVPEFGPLVLIGGSIYGPDEAEPILEAGVGTGRDANALLVLFNQLYAAEVKLANGATAGAAVFAAISDADAAILAAANAQVPGNGGDAMLTTNSHGAVVWDFQPSRSAVVKAASALGQEMLNDASILSAYLGTGHS
jgi:fibronectin type 3 domain-containing protein